MLDRRRTRSSGLLEVSGRTGGRDFLDRGQAPRSGEGRGPRAHLFDDSGRTTQPLCVARTAHPRDREGPGSGPVRSRASTPWPVLTEVGAKFAPNRYHAAKTRPPLGSIGRRRGNHLDDPAGPRGVVGRRFAHVVAGNQRQDVSSDATRVALRRSRRGFRARPYSGSAARDVSGDGLEAYVQVSVPGAVARGPAAGICLVTEVVIHSLTSLGTRP
jgi:hypothetical protein